MTPEVLMLTVEYRHFQCVDDSPDRINNPSCKQPEECRPGHIIQDLCKGQHAGPSHSDIKY